MAEGRTPATLIPNDAPLRGIALICIAVLAFVMMNVLVKLLASDYPFPQIIWARYFFHVAFILLLFPRRIPTLLVSPRKGLQFVRSLLVLLATACTFVALRYLPIADTVALSFIAPLLVTGLSVILLHEKVGPRRWIAVGVGFVGVLIITRPGAGVVHWAAALPIAMAFFLALYIITTRMISHMADPLNSLFYTALVGMLVTSIFVPFFWRGPTTEAWLMLCGVGVLGGAGHYVLIRAYERADASLVAPFSYTELIWAMLFGIAIFGDFPDVWTLAGAGVIAASGLYVLHRERIIKARPAAAEVRPVRT